jgi:hypothetical protein
VSGLLVWRGRRGGEKPVCRVAMLVRSTLSNFCVPSEEAIDERSVARNDYSLPDLAVDRKTMHVIPGRRQNWQGAKNRLAAPSMVHSPMQSYVDIAAGENAGKKLDTP